MGLPTDILNFFREVNARVISGVIRPYSVDDFVAAHGGQPGEIRRICQKFANEGFMIHAGMKNNKPLNGDCYYSITYDDSLAAYGSYDFMIDGFLSMRNHFSKSVRPVIVRKQNGQEDIGTCFYLGNNFLMTARHCVEDMKRIKIPSEKSGFIKVKSIIVPRNDHVDIAIIQAEPGHFENVPELTMENGNILDEVLTMGYPPISGFDAIQFVEIATINSHLKSSRGDIVGEGVSYLDTQEYLLINAKVKGGNSGGPILNKKGGLVGMLVHIPADSEDSTKLDLLGYGVAIPAAHLKAVIQNLNARNQDEVKVFPFENLDIGFRTGIPI